MSGPAPPLLAAAALVYGVAVKGRNELYDRGVLASEAPPLPTISVGNLTAGGTGKTPVVLHLAGRLLAEGTPVGVLSRGYGRTEHGLRIVLPGSPLPGPEVIGDEPWMLRTRLPGLALGIDAVRLRAARALASQLPNGRLLLDDGFQHRGLRRDLDLVVVAAAEPLRTARLLPAGRLREPITALARADQVVIVDSPAPGVGARALASLKESVAALAPRAPIAIAHPVLRGFRTLGGSDFVPASEVPRPVTAVAGIARPERLVATLGTVGVPVAGWAWFPDHHRYRPEDRRTIAAAASRAAAIITTEKDEPRLVLAQAAGMSVLPAEVPALAAVLDLDFSAGESELWRAVALAFRRQEK